VAKHCTDLLNFGNFMHNNESVVVKFKHTASYQGKLKLISSPVPFTWADVADSMLLCIAGVILINPGRTATPNISSDKYLGTTEQL